MTSLTPGLLGRGNGGTADSPILSATGASGGDVPPQRGWGGVVVVCVLVGRPRFPQSCVWTVSSRAPYLNSVESHEQRPGFPAS